MAAKKKPTGGRGASLLGAFRTAVNAEIAKAKGSQWPAPKWQKDPVGFVREVLGETVILPHQIDILNAAAEDNSRVAVCSGQKIGKTKLVIWLALWFYCSFPDAHVHMTATTKEQLRDVLWGELTNTIRRARAKGFEIEVPALDPGTGLVAEDGRTIKGFTVRDVEAVSGKSGEMLYIVDEASSLADRIAKGIEGNTIGGARIVWISNPSRTEGPFYDAFNTEQKKYWTRFTISSEDVANYCATKGITIRGIANQSIIEGWVEKYGRESPFFIVRVLGKFLINETGKIFTLGLITDAQERWAETPSVGTLTLGVDPAGPGDGGDEYAFAIVRGKKLLALHTFPGLTEEAAIAKIRGYIAEYREGDEIPTVNVDAEGPIGNALATRLIGIANTLRVREPAKSFECFAVRASAAARRRPDLYDKRRDELWANGAEWLKNGGAILRDSKLEAELHLPNWISILKGQLKATPKSEIRERLNRSPDSADAFLLAVWEARGWLVGGEGPEEEDPNAGYRSLDREDNFQGSDGIDPYAGAGSRGGSYDPYGP